MFGRRRYVGLEAIARGPIRVAGEAVMVEELEPVVDPVLAHRVHGDVADRSSSFCAAGEPLGRLGVVVSVVPNRILRVRPGMDLLAVYDEGRDDGVRVLGLDQRITSEAFDLHAILLPLRAARVP